MLDVFNGSKVELLLFTVPSLIAMILSLCRVEERISKPAAKRRRPSRFCEIGADDQPVISDPGRPGAVPGAEHGNAAGRRRAFVVAEDPES